MLAPTRSPRSRPNGAPAYYLARPVGVWITTLHRPPVTGRAAAGPAGTAPRRQAARPVGRAAASHHRHPTGRPRLRGAREAACSPAASPPGSAPGATRDRQRSRRPFLRS